MAMDCDCVRGREYRLLRLPERAMEIYRSVGDERRRFFLLWNLILLNEGGWKRSKETRVL